MASQWMSSLDNPVDIVGNVSEEPATVTNLKILENHAHPRKLY